MAAKRYIADCITCIDDVPATTISHRADVVLAADYDALSAHTSRLVARYTELTETSTKRGVRVAVLESMVADERAIMQALEEALDSARDRLSEQQHPDLFRRMNTLLKEYDASLGRGTGDSA